MKHISMGFNALGLNHVLSVNDDGQCVNRTIQSAAQNQAIIDTNTSFRQMYQDKKAELKKRLSRGGFMHAASIPVTLYHQWKKEWKNGYANSMSWNRFRDLKINSREFDAFRPYDRSIAVPDMVARE